jgi:resuscitation-promoting factor RpfB
LLIARDASLLLLLFLFATSAIMVWSYFVSMRPVMVVAGNQQTTLWTRQSTVRGALIEAGFAWQKEDVIQPGLDDSLPSDGRIMIRPAIPVALEADGNVLRRLTQSTTVEGVLRENGIELKASDKVYLNGRAVRLRTSLPRKSLSSASNLISIPKPALAHILVERAIPISVNDNGLVSTVYTTEPTLGMALSDSGVLVYLGDYVSPDLGSPVASGESVFIRRSRAATISVDGREIRTRTRASNVAQLLAQEGIQLVDKDYSAPTPTNPVFEGISVAVTRVREVYVTETQSIAFETHWLPNPDMEIDSRSTPQAGAAGIKNRLVKSVYENGKLISQGLEREWIAKAPQDKIINYGTKIAVSEMTLPDGNVVHYWRVLRLLATSYTPSTSGKPQSNPLYGHTYLGLNAGRGIVAVDPRVINLRSNVYVPGYGIGLAGDTGGGIRGRRIDLGFPDGSLEDWFRWVNVYVLTPVPALNQINYVVSDYPVERPASQR